MNTRDTFAFTPLIALAKSGVGDVAARVRVLLEVGVALDAVTEDGKSAMAFAAERGDSKLMAVLQAEVCCWLLFSWESHCWVQPRTLTEGRVS